MFTSCDVVLTTWHELNQSVPWPDADTLLRLRQLNRVRKDRSIDDESSPIVEWIEDHQEEGGNLHQIYWRRVSPFRLLFRPQMLIEISQIVLDESVSEIYLIAIS